MNRVNRRRLNKRLVKVLKAIERAQSDQEASRIARLIFGEEHGDRFAEVIRSDASPPISDLLEAIRAASPGILG